MRGNARGRAAGDVWAGVPLVLWVLAVVGTPACRRAEIPPNVDSASAEKSVSTRPLGAASMPKAATAEVAARTLPEEAAEAASVSEAQPVSLRERLGAALQISAPGKRREALGDLGAALAAHDPAGATEVFRQIESAKGAESAEAYAFASAFVSDYAALAPASAAEWMATLPLTLQFGVSTFVAREWSKADLAAATMWAEEIAEPSLRAAVLARMGETLQQAGDPSVMAEWARHVAALPDAAQYAAMIGRLWAVADPQGAFQWSASLGNVEQQATAVLSIAGTLAMHDPVSAANWVAQFPEGDLRRQAAAVTSANWAEADPEAAARWIASLSDQELMESAIHPVARRWLGQDRRNATEWLRSAPLKPETKRYLLGEDAPKG